MKFAWTKKYKEHFFKMAQRQLEEAGIDFITVDRKQFGVKGWDAEKGTVQSVIVQLQPYPYKHFSNAKRGMLKRLGNWKCTDKYRRGYDKPIHMHSQLTFTSYTMKKQNQQPLQ